VVLARTQASLKEMIKLIDSGVMPLADVGLDQAGYDQLKRTVANA